MGALALLAGLAIVVSGCGDRTQTTSSPTSGGGDLPGRAFVSTKVTEAGKPRALAPNTKISVQFTKDGRLIADAGCNTMQAPVDTGDGKLALSDLAITDMGCDQPRHNQDTWLAGLLQAGPSWRLDAGHLVVTSGKTELVLLDKEVATPDAAVEGTKWLVFTYVDKETASHKDYLPGAKQQPYLTFKGGKVTGWTGCNQFSGSAKVTGDRITFGPIMATKMACTQKEAAADEAHVLDVLTGTVTYEATANSLELKNPNGKGLGLDKA
ncbi:META domain-containing protein [Flindersiella endophytica]